jgi:hypothetical protein
MSRSRRVFVRGVLSRPGVDADVFAGVLIGVAIIAIAIVLRAGLPAWIGLIVAMVVFSNNPADGAHALAAGVGVWIVLRYLRGSRA